MKKIVIVVVLVTVIMFLALVSLKPLGGNSPEILDMSQAVPLAPEFELRDVDNRLVKLSDLRGKVVVLNFWATWCPPCREEIPSMNQLQQLMVDAPVAIVAVNIEPDGPETVPKYKEQHSINFTVLYDVDGVVHKQYGVFKYPETYIIDQNGVVVNKVIGATDWSSPQVVNYIRSLINP